MTAIAWHRRVITIIIAIIISPLIGIILLWLRKETKILWRIVWTIPVLLFAVIHLAVTIGILMQLGWIESSGNMLDGTFYIKRGGSASHYEAVEKSRAAKQADVPLASEANGIQSTYWTNFWGPNFDGHYGQTPIRTNTHEQPWEVLWKQPIGGGYASFVIAKGVAYTIEQRRDEEFAAAYDITNGNELWTTKWQALFHETMGGEGPRATPAWDNDRLYVLGATGHFVSLNAENGELIWEKNIVDDNGAQNIMWGIAASPLVAGDLVITVPGGGNNNMIVAYNKLTGEKKWSALNDTIKYSSPFIANILGEQQIVYTSQERVVGLSPSDGALLWEYRYERGGAIDHKIGQPIVIDGDKIFASSGYGYGCDLFQLSKEGDKITTAKLWKNRNMKNRFSSPIYWDGHIYGLDESIFCCLDMDGNLKWKGGRYGYGQVIMADGHFIVLTERGEVVLLNASPEKHEEISSQSVIKGKTWNFPAASDGYLLVRNANEMACLRINE